MQSSLSHQILKSEFANRQIKNPRYSLRKFAKDLGLSQAFVSQIFSGNRKLSIQKSLQIVDRLKLPPQKRAAFLDSVHNESIVFEKRKTLLQSILGADQFACVSRWYHFAILDLTTLANFKSDIDWISRTLGITNFEAKDAIERLERLGLLVRGSQGVWKKTSLHVQVPTTKSLESVRSFHLGILEKAQSILQETSTKEFSRRSITTTILAVNPKKLNAAQKLIEEFRKKLISILSEDPCEDVYALGVQLFPLTKSRGKN